MKVLVIFTGGTIGSTWNDGIVSTDLKKNYKLISMYREQYNTNVEFDYEEPYSMLSENMTGKEYSILVSCIRRNLKMGYDGIIITHGSDTLQYTAAMLSFVFGNNVIPIVLVASNYILEDKRANGLENFTGGITLIQSKSSGGVFVSYKNKGECCKIHRGERLLSFEIYKDELYSLLGLEYGQIIDDQFLKNELYQDCKRNITLNLPENMETSPGILCIQAMPGMIYPQLDQSVKGIIYTTFHSGTICSTQSSLQEFAKEASQLKIPIYVVGDTQESFYKSKKIYQDLDMKVIPPIAPVAFYIKLWLAIGNKMELDTVMFENRVGEYLLEANTELLRK